MFKIYSRLKKTIPGAKVTTTIDIQEINEDEAVLMESLQDEAANSKIKLSLLIKISSSLLGLKSILQNLEVSRNENLLT